jgi:tripeptidyl-peptidase-1
MGWINPWIYANPQMFTDVTEGSNPYEKCDGFYASGRSPSRLSLCLPPP